MSKVLGAVVPLPMNISLSTGEPKQMNTTIAMESIDEVKNVNLS